MARRKCVNNKYKEGKTESVLYGTSQRVAKQNDTLNVKYRGAEILNASEYKYLGIEVDNI